MSSEANTTQLETYTAFVGARRIAAGPLREIVPALKSGADAACDELLLLFHDETGRQVELDLRGTLDEVLEREAPAAARSPGRPRLGVVSREISLLPRHWDWLEAQPNGASAALRRLVDHARKTEPGKQRAARVRAALSRFMTSMAGNLPGYEEASRALFAGEQAQLERLIARWPEDIRTYVRERSRDAARAAASDAPV